MAQIPYKVLDKGWRVPEFLFYEYFPKRNRYCICVFVLNEGERIQRQLGRMKPFAAKADIIIADGGSRDGSLKEGFLREVEVRALLIKKGPGKLGAQMRMAFAYCLQEGYKGIIVMDGNDKDEPSAIPLFIETLEAGFDYVQGSRYIKGGKGVNTPLFRDLAVRLIHAPMISLAAGYHYTDTTNGFRGYRPEFLLNPGVLPFRDVFSGYEFHYYLAIRAAELKYKIREIPVTRRYPKKDGQIPTKIIGLKGNRELMKALIKACFHKFDP